MSQPPVAAYRDEIMPHVDKLVFAANDIGGSIEAMGQLILNAFKAELMIISEGIQRQKPENAVDLRGFLDPMILALNKIQEHRDRNRGDMHFNCLSAISESAPALNWISVEKTPVPFVKDMTEAGHYYGNRVLKDHRNDPIGAWVALWFQVLANLQEYIRKYHITGFSWGLRTPQTSALSGPPPPPPPPPAPEYFKDGGADDASNERAALLKDLNQGLDITRRLRARDNGKDTAVSQKDAPRSKFSSKTFAQEKKVHPPKLALDGKRWSIEYQIDKQDIVIDQAQMSESVSIFHCEKSVIQVKNKVNYITIDGCKKTSVLVNDIISSIEIIHSDGVTVQCEGKVPLINVDSSDGVHIYTSKRCEDVEIVSSKSSTINVSVPISDGDYAELPVPEQIRTVIAGGKLKSSVIEKN